MQVSLIMKSIIITFVQELIRLALEAEKEKQLVFKVADCLLAGCMEKQMGVHEGKNDRIQGLSDKRK